MTQADVEAIRKILADALAAHAKTQDRETHIKIDKLAYALGEEEPTLFVRLAERVSQL